VSIATSPIAGFEAPRPIRSAARSLWTVIKRKPLGIGSAALILLLVLTANLR